VDETKDALRSHFYVLAESPVEAQRLHQQSLLVEEGTRQIFDGLGLAPGMRCIEIGCGHGDIMMALGDRVGHAGTVVGVDLDGELGLRVVEQLNRTGQARFTFKQGDVTDPNTLPRDQFDVVAARFLLIHLADPAAALRAMWDLTKPGGVLVVFDWDLRTHSTYPEFPPAQEIIRLFEGVYGAPGRDCHIGSKLPGLFGLSGVGTPDGAKVFCIIEPLEKLREHILLQYRGVLPTAIKLGVTTAERSDAVIAAMEALPPENCSYWLGALYFGVWKRKSEEAGHHCS